MTDNNKCAGSCGTHGSVWVDGYHGQKKVNVLSDTAQKVALMSEFNVNLANCCVPLINGSPNDIFNIIAPYANSKEDLDPTPSDLYTSFSVENTASWKSAAGAIDTDLVSASTDVLLDFIDGYAPLKPTLVTNTSATPSLLKLKIEFKDETNTTLISTISFDFVLDDPVISGKVYQASFADGSPQYFVYKNALIQFILPSIVFTGDIDTPGAGSVNFVNLQGLQVFPLLKGLHDFITCDSESCSL